MKCRVGGWKQPTQPTSQPTRQSSNCLPPATFEMSYDVGDDINHCYELRQHESRINDRLQNGTTQLCSTVQRPTGETAVLDAEGLSSNDTTLGTVALQGLSSESATPIDGLQCGLSSDSDTTEVCRVPRGSIAEVSSHHAAQITEMHMQVQELESELAYATTRCPRSTHNVRRQKSISAVMERSHSRRPSISHR